jgi:hypothetical protein
VCATDLGANKFGVVDLQDECRFGGRGCWVFGLVGVQAGVGEASQHYDRTATAGASNAAARCLDHVGAAILIMVIGQSRQRSLNRDWRPA